LAKEVAGGQDDLDGLPRRRVAVYVETSAAESVGLNTLSV
jgi:hypothetical protein